jgi:uncharacterized protein (UPF0276 family)
MEPVVQPMFANLGRGLGLRREHYRHVVERKPTVDWFEVISENFMAPGGNPRRVLEAVRRDYPVVLHGVSLSIASTEPLDHRYLDQLAELAASVEPSWISDHLSWGTAHGISLHDLLPIPYTEEALAHICRRVETVQDRLGRRILIENPSSYLSFKGSEMTEYAFLAELARRADCGILLDVNNVFVSAYNHGFDPHAYIAAMPAERVGQIHLAGHSREGGLLIDTHDGFVCREVWQLYAEAIALLGPRSTMIEWDAKVPEFDVLEHELARAAHWARFALEGKRGEVPDAA